MKLFPRHCPDWRVKGQRPANAAISLRVKVPSSGSSAMRVRAAVGPTPGTEVRSSSFARHNDEALTAECDGFYHQARLEHRDYST